MLLYLSSAAPEKHFSDCLRQGLIRGGHQAQRFNSLVIRGLSAYQHVFAVSNPPFTQDRTVSFVEEVVDGVGYFCLGNHPGKLHKLKNLIAMKKAIEKAKKDRCQFEAVICDAINPIASLNAIWAAKKYRLPSIAIVTDIPSYMDYGRKTLFTVLTDRLMRCYDGYVFLTKQMDAVVNPRHRPFIVMEGLCDAEITESSPIELRTSNPMILLYTGSLSKGTGLEQMMEGFLLAKLPEAELHIYGNGELVEMIRQVEHDHPTVRYCGIVTNAEAVTAQQEAELLINPRPTTIRYGSVSFPSKLMEYMASGTPVLTTRLPGIPEEYWEYLYTISVDTSEGIAESLRSCMAIATTMRRKKGAEAKEFVLKEKNNRMQAARILTLLGSIKKQNAN